MRLIVMKVARSTALLGLLTAVMLGRQAAAAGDPSYPAMAPVSEYLIASQAEEISLARSAAPASISDHADVLVLGAHGYETPVKGTNGFACFVGRSWDLDFADPQFWNQKIRAPQCNNATAARSVLPAYLTRTKWAMSGVAKADMQKREAAARATGGLKEPEPGSVSYMLSKRSYINDTVNGPLPAHVMLFVPRTEESSWGANLPGSPVAADSTTYQHTTIFFVSVPKWSDGTPVSLHK